MLHHLSIAAQDPQRVARVLAEVMGGTLIPFPSHHDSFFALALDELGTGIEVYPAGTQLRPGFEDKGAQFVDTKEESLFVATHCALSVTLELEQIQEIAWREGWRIQVCDRGTYFQVIELWLENTTLIELLPPSLARRYQNFMSPENLKRMLGGSEQDKARELTAVSR